MDIFCGRCGEPVDLDELHYVEDNQTGRPVTFDVARKRFAKIGCAALDGGASPTCEQTNSLRSLASDTLMEIMGDDMDGVASMLDNLDYAGMLDG